MISLSPTVTNILSQPSVEAFYMVSIEGAEYNKTSHFTNVVYDSVEYVADGSLYKLDPQQIISVVDKQPFNITLVDVESSLGSMTNTLVGKSVKVYVGFVDQLTGLPVTTTGDAILLYKGQIDSFNYTIETSEIGSIYFNIVCSSPMADLDMVKQYTTSQDYLDKNAPGDTSYELIYDGVGQINLLWGKG